MHNERLHKTSRRDAMAWDWDKIYWAETETYCSETETRPEMHWFETETRLRRWLFCPRQDRDETLVRLETVSRLIRLNRDHIPAVYNIVICHAWHVAVVRAFAAAIRSRTLASASIALTTSNCSTCLSSIDHRLELMETSKARTCCHNTQHFRYGRSVYLWLLWWKLGCCVSGEIFAGGCTFPRMSITVSHHNNKQFLFLLVTI